MRDVIALLEAYGENAEATVHPVELDEIIRPLDLEEVIERPLPPLRTRPRWVVAFVAAVVVVALIGGIALLVQSPVGEEPPVVTQPPAPTTTIPNTATTTTPSTTTPPPTTSPTTSLPPPTTTPASDPAIISVGPISSPNYAGVPSFTGTVHFYEHDPALGSFGWEATVDISHAGPLLYEATMVTGGEPYLGPSGTSYLGDGAVMRIVNPDGTDGDVLGAIDNFRSLYFDSEWPSPPWDEICAEGAVSLGSEELLGRATTHLACSGSSEDSELWVDEASGLVLKMAGPLSIGDYHPTAARDGGFAFTELVFEPVTIFEPPPIETAQTGEFPPFHMIRSATGVVPNQTLEIWYQHADRLREGVIAGEWVGSFTLIADGRLAGCNVYGGDPSCYNVPIEDADDIYPVRMPYHQVPVSLVEESCAEVPQEVVAGRPARHFVCDGVDFGNTGIWFVVPAPDSQSEYWFEVETGLAVREVHSGYEMEVTLLELNPVFPVGIFEYEG